jgi:hypothetical protein
VHLLRVAFTKIAAKHAKLSPEAVLSLAVRSVNSMKASTGLSRLEIDCGRPARHPPLSEELFALSPPVLPAFAHEIEEFMNAADEKRQFHQVMRARQRLNASLRAQVSGRSPALRNGDSFLYWRTSVVRSQSGWRGPAIVIARQRNMVNGFMGGIVVLCHRTRARLFERSSRDEKPSPLLDDDAFLPFQGKGVDSSAPPALTAQDADDFVQSPFVTDFMPVEFEDVEFRDVAETGRHLGDCFDDPVQAARVARSSAAGPASNLSKLMNTAPVRDTVPDAFSSAAEPVTSVEHMKDDDDDDDRPQARCCHLTLRTFWSRLIPLRNMPLSQTRNRSLIFRRCALVQYDQSRMRTTIIRSTKTLKRRRSANVFILPQLCTRTSLRWMTRRRD